jgi:hypothetical protein
MTEMAKWHVVVVRDGEHGPHEYPVDVLHATGSREAIRQAKGMAARATGTPVGQWQSLSAKEY